MMLGKIMSEYTIKKLDQMPKVKPKVKKKGDIRVLIEQFDKEEMKFAEIPVKGKDSTGLKIGIGRILKKDKRTDIEWSESLDGKSIILKRK